MKMVLADMALLPAAGAAQALVYEACAFTAHVISHGGEAGHANLGAGPVMLRDGRWSQARTASDIDVIDCRPVDALTAARTAGDKMGARIRLDRSAEALGVIARHGAGGPVFATLDRIAADLDPVACDVLVSTQDAESCACAAFYPDLRDDKLTFDLDG